MATRKKEEPVEVEATLVEETEELARVDFTPATITVDWEGIDAKLDEMLAPYDGVTAEVVADMDPKEVQVCKRDLGRISTELDDAKKAIKKAYTAPLNAFEEAVKQRIARIDGKKSLFDEAVKVEQERWKDARRQLLADAYYEYCAGNGMEALADNIKPERIIEDVRDAMLKKTSEKMAVKLVEGRTSEVMRDYRTLHRHQLAFQDEAEVEFFKTLSIAAALEKDARRKAEQERLDALRADMDDAAKYREGQDEQVPVEAYEPDAMAVAEEHFGVTPERVETYALFIEVTASQKAALIDYLRAHGVHGKPVRTPHATWQQAVAEYTEGR